MPSKKWSYDICKEIASKFTELRSFAKEFPLVYAAARRKGWVNDYTWLKVCKNHGYWDYNKCYEEARKYVIITGFAKGCPGGFQSAKRNGWIKDYTWFIDGRKLEGQRRRVEWDYDTCYKLAQDCNKKSQMAKKCGSAYKAALKNNWVKDYTWFLSDEEIRHQKRPSTVKWSYEVCRDKALQFDTLAKFEKAFPSAYTISKRNGWIDDFDWLSRACYTYKSIIDNVYAYFFTEFHTVYVGRTIDPSARNVGHTTSEKSVVFRFAAENKVHIPKMVILESGLTLIQGLEKEDYYRQKYCNEGWDVLNTAKTGIKSGSLGALGSGKWNYDACYKEAKKYKLLKDFRKKSSSAYSAACRYGWKNDYTWLKAFCHERGYWDYDRCYEEAKKYKTRKQFQVGSVSAYCKALNEKWLDDYIWFETICHKSGYWNYDRCYEEAKKYTALCGFIKNSATAYRVSRENDWLKQFNWLTKKDISKKAVLQYSLDGKFIAKYDGVREACRICGIKSNSGISACCNGKLKKHNGYIWKYEEV